MRNPASPGFFKRAAAHERLARLVDEGSFSERDQGLKPKDPLKFVDSVPYGERLRKYQKNTGLNEAVVCGTGKIHGIPVSFAASDFRFGAGSMGSVVGEKITRAIELGIEERIPVIVFSASGGARMQEGILSLMQMAKTSAAVGRLSKAGVPFISVLTYPTTGGVTASYATLGDVILAEPGALVGFAGQRVIKETTNEELPEGFQTAEFLMERGLIDQIVPRTEMRDRLGGILAALYLKKKPVGAS